jgi:AraC-like DNA-binding protein
MKPPINKIVDKEKMSFVTQAVSTPYFQTDLHQHIEYELILFTKGSGVVYVGDYEGNYTTGDIYFIGSNLPHAFKNNSQQPVGAIVLLFRDNCLGNHFMNLHECKAIRQLLGLAARGLQVTRNSQHYIESFIREMEKATSINKLITLLQCLDRMSSTNEYSILSKKKAREWNYRKNGGIDKALEFTATSFSDPISLSQVAAIACMSIPSFCHYFKLLTGKTYIDHLNQIRISYASRQLQETNKSITAICYESGYNTFVHFHRKFYKLKRITPLQYRKSLELEMPIHH